MLSTAMATRIDAMIAWHACAPARPRTLSNGRRALCHECGANSAAHSVPSCQTLLLLAPEGKLPAPQHACSCMLAHVVRLQCALSVCVQTSTGNHASMLLRHWQLLDAELAEHAKAHIRETRELK